VRNIARDPKRLRLSLVEASEGKIGTTVDPLLLLCRIASAGRDGLTCRGRVV
jgi:hypothetical protein